MLGTSDLVLHQKMAPTQAMVLQLVESLPYTKYQFTIVLDNLFTTPRLQYQLWKRQIGSVGTCKPLYVKNLFSHILKVNATKDVPIVAPFVPQPQVTTSSFSEQKRPRSQTMVLLPSPKAKKSRTRISDSIEKKNTVSLPEPSQKKISTVKVVAQDWGTLTSIKHLVYPCILASCWVDNSIVSLLSTIFDGHGWILRTQKAPRALKNSKINKAARAAFWIHTDEPEKIKHQVLLPIPTLIHFYNQFMNGVDLANQLRRSFTTHQSHRRLWVAL